MSHKVINNDNNQSINSKRENSGKEAVLNSIGIRMPEIMLPSEHMDLRKWAVVACDQYTSQPSYWKSVEELVGNAPSTLHMIFPEVYLEDDDKKERIANITRAMKKCIDNGFFRQLPPAFVYVERVLAPGTRRGLLAALDLEQYDYREGSQTLIRATEGTVLDRLPPRIEIRKDAVLEVPHIMVLIDDPDRTVIEPVSQNLSEADKLYDFELMMDGGRVVGYKVTNPAHTDKIIDALCKLADPPAFRKKYNVGGDKGVLLYAMGDGNHSFATAKACWDRLKVNLSEEERQNHPARFAMVELVNVHDDSLVFEPIHRVLFRVKPEHVLDAMKEYYAYAGQGFEYESFDSEKKMRERYQTLLSGNAENGHFIPCMFSGEWGLLKIRQPGCNLEAGSLQAFLDDYLAKNKEASIDYIHGEEVTAELGLREGNMGFLLPIMNKNDLFKTVIVDGVLPRKTFSMGEAHEKRFYLECRRIVK